MAEEQGNDKGTEVDLDLLEIEIDKEIDNLFVPKVKAQPVSEESGNENGVETASDSLEIEIGREVDNLFVPAPEGQQTQPEAGIPPVTAEQTEKTEAGMDLDKLQSEIDKEIDSLFIPAGGLEYQTESLSMEQADIFMPGPEAAAAVPAVERQPVQAEESQFAAAKDFAFAQLGEQYSPAAPTGFRANYPPRAELPKLLEEFNAAYLSLDWEFSSDNIRRLEYALQDLESFANSPGAATIFKILKAVLARLGANPQAANNWIVDLIRDSQGLLAHLLLTEGLPGPQERERINALVSRFRQMHQKAAAAKSRRAAEFSSGQAQVRVDVAGMAPALTLPVATVSGKMPDRWSLLELKTWMESSNQRLIEAVEGAGAQLARIRQIESALGKTEALSPVVARLSDIRGGLERFLDSLIEQGNEWGRKAALVESLERISAASEAAAENQVEDLTEAGDEDDNAQPGLEPVESLESQPPSPVTPQEAPVEHKDLWIFRYSGKLYGIPESNLVKSRQVSRKKAREILDRGYATLADVKQLFRSIRTGVTGSLAWMSGKDLKSIKFNLIAPGVFQSVQGPLGPMMAIFVTDGGSYGLILADSETVDFQAEAELSREACSCRAAVGTVRTDSGICAEVLDMGQVFKM